MSVLDEVDDYKENPYYKSHKQAYGDFTPFYITVTICTVIGISLFILNIVLGCCSRYSGYWNDRFTDLQPIKGVPVIVVSLKPDDRGHLYESHKYYTWCPNDLCADDCSKTIGDIKMRFGNRFITSLWTASPHQQPPLDLTELELINVTTVQQGPRHQVIRQPAPPPPEQAEFLELKPKRESDI